MMSPPGTVTVERLETPRLVLRPPVDADRDAAIHLGTDSEVTAHLGGPADRREVEAGLDARPLGGRPPKPGTYVVAHRTTDKCLGLVTLDRRPASCRGHVVPAGEELEIGFTFARWAWGHGYAEEAARALLRAAAAELSDQPVVLVTQTANLRSLALAARLGFAVVQTFIEFDAEQTLATARLATFTS